MVSAMVLALPESASLARRVSDLAGMPLSAVESRQFPDDETYLRIDAECTGKSVVLVCTLDHPNQKTLPLLFLADAARALGARRVGLVTPYLAYLRQDRQFRAGEAVTSRTFARLLSGYVDWIVTIDPHLHRYGSLNEIYGVPSRVIHAAPVVAAWIAEHVERPVLVGPDVESAQWVTDVASRVGAPSVVMRKERSSDQVVKVSAPDMEAYRQHTPVIIDDVVSSGHTLIETVKCLVSAGLRAPVCMAVHALFSKEAEQALSNAGTAGIVTSNSVPHSTNMIDVVPLMIPAVLELC
ncbi:MAG: ribose-phosphate pyrophosphokinase [Acidobacteria bacterium]|nr:ribose-phosphate pyrophosphokinase [Acidobacteriota bacterium]